MGLPTGGTWPPQHLQPIYSHYQVLDTWYRGVPEELHALYSGQQPPNRPSQYRGGLVGWAARTLWGQPVPAGEKLTKLHVPIASDICSMSSDLLFSEPPTVTATNPQTQERINEMLPGLQATLLEGADVGAALGGYFLRAVSDPEVAEKPWLAAVHADAADAEWRHGHLRAATFWRIVEQDDNERLVHLERHEPGVILHGLYRGAPGQLGEKVKLTDSAETAKLQPTIQTRVERRPTAVYVPNMRPNRAWRNFPAGANLGRSDFDGAVLGLMDALDEVWTSWMRDIRIGKGRVHVPASYLQNMGKGQGAYWDPDREIYEALEMLGGQDRMELSATQFAIRIVEHRDTAAELMAEILRATGYSAQSFGLSGEVAVTATEVAAKERRSLVTRGRKGLYTVPALQDAIEMLLQFEAGLGQQVTPERPAIVLADSVSPDMMQLAQTVELMRRAEAISDETAVRMLHPDWDEKKVREEVRLIEDARPDPMADPFALPGEMTGGGPEGEEQDGPPEREK